MSVASVAARVAVGVAGIAWRSVPPALRGRLEHRWYLAIRRVTRVTDDGYPQPAGVAAPGPGEKIDREA